MFDIDGTVTPNKHLTQSHKKDGKAAVITVVNQCKTNGYKIAINTARPHITKSMQKYLTTIGINLTDLPQGAVQTGKITSHSKQNALETIQYTYGIINPDNILFFDDRAKNILAAKNAGFFGMQIVGGMISDTTVDAGKNYFNTRNLK